MKNKSFFLISLLSIVLLVLSFSCKKSDDKADNDLTSLNGLWRTTVFGGDYDTLIVSINTTTANGIITYINKKAVADTKFAVNDILFTDIKSSGNSLYTATGTYSYGVGSAKIGHTGATLKMNSSTILFIEYSPDQSTGINPPDYYYYKIK